MAEVWDSKKPLLTIMEWGLRDRTWDIAEDRSIGKHSEKATRSDERCWLTKNSSN